MVARQIINQCIEKAGTIRKLAEVSGYHHNQISQYRLGIIEPPFLTVVNLMQSVGASFTHNLDDIPAKRKLWDEKHQQEIREMINQGFTVDRIASEYSLHSSTIHRRIKRHNLRA